MNLSELLSGRMTIAQVKRAAQWASASPSNLDELWTLSESSNLRIAANALWIMTHLSDPPTIAWLADRQSAIILRLLSETNTAKKRMMLQLLREQTFDASRPEVVQLLDYCFSKINAECEPYAVRCLSIYIALKICRPYPELIAELQQYLGILTLQPLSPGLRCALRTAQRTLETLG